MTAVLLRRLGAVVPPLILAGVAGWFAVRYGLPALDQSRPTLRAPDWELLLAQPAAVRLHLGTALLALVIGGVQLAGVKGTTMHRALGWTWVAAMAVTAVSSLFIRQVNDGAFSFIHILSGLTIVALPMAVHAARRHDVKKHRSEMIGLFVGALLIAGALSLLPGRLLWAVFVGG